MCALRRPPLHKSAAESSGRINWRGIGEKAKSTVTKLLFEPSWLWFFGCCLLELELVLCPLIIRYVNYTEIDWQAYMEQVALFMNGTRDYTKLEGGTGPCVYPAGHVYIYTLLYYFTDNGLNIRIAQFIFAGIYLLNLVLVFRIYRQASIVPPYVLALMCLGAHRIHSIYLLRLFNDPIAVLFLHVALLLLMEQKLTLACIVYSFAVSVKMNILLYAPAVGVILVAFDGYLRTAARLFLCALVQLLLAAPFLQTNAVGYVQRSFNFGRQFFHEWTVNWRFLPEEFFTNRLFHAALIAAHLLFLFTFAKRYWFRPKQHMLSVLFSSSRMRAWKPSAYDVLFAMFSANFIGIMFSRTLHYQFYVWYYYSIPFLLWNTEYSTVFRLLVWGLIEYCWNVFPSTNFSSGLLHICHIVIFLGVCRRWNRFSLPFCQHEDETEDDAHEQPKTDEKRD